MILEHADIRIHPGKQAAFDEAIQRGINTVISKAKGFQGYKVNKGIENPERYVLQIFWETLENHTVDFQRIPGLCGVSRHCRTVFCGPAGSGTFRAAGQIGLSRRFWASMPV